MKKSLRLLFSTVVYAQTASAGHVAYTAYVNAFNPSAFYFDTFGIMDLDTGTFEQIGPMGGFVPNLSQLTWARGNLYASGFIIGGVDNAVTNQVYLINPGNGSFTLVGNLNVVAGDFAGLFGVNGDLYALGIPSLNLYSFDPVSGTTTTVGRTGIPAPAPDLSNLFTITGTGLGDSLYVDYLLTDAYGNPLVPDSLYRIDPRNAQTTLVGGVSGAQCLTGLGQADGKLYGFSLDPCKSFIGPGNIVEIDPRNAVASFVSRPALNAVLTFADVRGQSGAAVGTPALEPAVRISRRPWNIK